MSILLQPCANKNARRHFEDTIATRVDLERIARHLPDTEMRAIRRFATPDGVMVWGLTPAADDSSVRIWRRLARGDIVAFYARRKVFFTGLVAGRVISRSLARDLWGAQPDGQTWELIYFLSEGKKSSCPLRVVTDSLGYPTDRVLRARLCKPDPSVEDILWP